MATPFGTLVERLLGAQVFFAPDGTAIGGSTPFTTPLSNVVKVSAPTTAYADYSLGRVNNVKYNPKTKDVTREWASAYGGYKNRTDKRVLEDAFDFTVIDYAPQLIDQLTFGTAALADPTLSSGVQQAFQKSTRYKDGWFYTIVTNEAGVAIAKLEIHARLTLTTVPEWKNEPGSPVLHLAHLADAGALDVVTFAVG